MSTSGDLTFAPLTNADIPSLHAFRCARIHEPWSLPIEEELQRTLPGDLAEGRADALGLWAGTTLGGVVAWRRTSPLPVRHVLYLAVSLEQRGRGAGRRLKERVIEDARDAGLRAVTSGVHELNLSMLGLNERLGAEVEGPDEDGYCRCTILL